MATAYQIKRELQQALRREKKLATLLDECRTTLAIVAVGIHRNKEMNACWISGEAVAVHAVEQTLKKLEDYIEGK